MPKLTKKKIDPTGLIGSTYRLFGISQNKHVYGDVCIGELKRWSALADPLARTERDITEVDKVYFRENFGKVTNIWGNKCEQIILRFLIFLMWILHLNLLYLFLQ